MFSYFYIYLHVKYIETYLHIQPSQNMQDSNNFTETRKIIVMIGSHISNVKRIHFLYETIFSLIKQTYTTGIYLSISFDTKELENDFMKIIIQDKLFEIFSIFCSFHYYIREQKTPQMKHLQLICSHLLAQKSPPPEWILFSDDDDTHAEDRVEQFAKRIELCETDLKSRNENLQHLVGLYETHDFGLNHKLQRHEYWCYCVRFSLLCDFFDKLQPYPSVIENKLCDIVLCEFLRRRKEPDLFSFIDAKLYNYRRENNSDSITGRITNKSNMVTRSQNPPPIDSEEIVEYIKELNDYIHKHTHIYLHDTFLRTVVGMKFDDILRAEFLADYPLLKYVDICHTEILRVFHERLREICNSIYDENFS